MRVCVCTYLYAHLSVSIKSFLLKKTFVNFYTVTLCNWNGLKAKKNKELLSQQTQRIKMIKKDAVDTSMQT